ncbi:MAG TPA: c-type cytochrome [Thermoanaerobaculia bacterium]|nr:c-type cytochrome [Thermoanaerobaculia bacterium]
MPRKPPAEPIDHHYNIPRLNRAFFWSAGILTAVFLWMVLADYKRDWKSIQQTFLRLDRDKTMEAVEKAREKAYGEERDKLRAQLVQARQDERAHRATMAKLNAHLKELDPKLYGADQDAKFLKASFDAARYTYEDNLANRPKSAPKAGREVADLEKKLDGANLRLAKFKRDEAETKAELKRITGKHDEAQAAIDKLSADYKLARQKVETLKQDTLFKLRNSPILDMVNPSLRVQQVQLPEHFNDVNFMRIPRVDRCGTCHMAADRKGFEKASLDELTTRYPKLKKVIGDGVVYETHPRINLMVGSESPHPVGDFGCTPCHGGRDRASSFWSAGHSPETSKEETRWKRKYDWEFDKFNEMPILPIKYADAGCYRCHADETNFPEAPRLDAAMRMVESLGCWGCHRIEGLEKQNLPRVGPSLEKVSSKVSKEWTTRWVMAPDTFRANTKMPSFFYQENFVNVSGDKKPTKAQQDMNVRGKLENDAMVNSVVAYLFEKSHPAPVPAAPGSGDAARGEKLLASRGCYGCHQVDPRADAPRDLTGTYRQFGPNLAGIGSKASKDWIYQWISDPKRWNPETKMPNLRLSQQDALDIAEYLSTLKSSPHFEQAALPQTDPRILDDIAFYFETATKTRFDARADLDRMDLHAKEVYTGEKLIAHYGCFACHRIPGFEEAKPIGTELTEEGSKAVHRLDFGFLHLPHTRQDWFRTKLHNPRIFDRDRARGWEERLRMPNFRFRDDELDNVVTAVLGFQKLNASAAAKKELSGERASIERGRRIVKDHNCQGCHVIEGFGGSIRSLAADPSLAPPVIQGEGAKVQSDWLFSFLKAPKTGQIRPWLEVHMPTFGFTDAELNDLTRYFAYLDRAAYPFLTSEYATEPARWAAGRKVFEVLRCRQCHPRSEQEMNAVEDKSSLAPNLQMAAKRLRHDWINDWIRRPDEWMPGTRMPTNFPKGDTGVRTSPLGAMVDAPAFAKDRAEFAQILGGDDAAKKFLEDPDAVTRALRDYVWSIGINGGTAPAGGPAPAAPPETKPAAAGARASGRASSRTAPAAP